MVVPKVLYYTNNPMDNNDVTNPQNQNQPAIPQTVTSPPPQGTMPQPQVFTPRTAPATASPPPPTRPPLAEHHGKSPLKRLILGIVIILIATVLIVLFFPKGKSEKVELTWWGLWEDGQVVEPVIVEFERDHPNIAVTYSKQDPNQYRERLVTRVGIGTGPDIFRYHNTWFPMLSEILLPLPTEVIAQEDFKKKLLSSYAIRSYS